MHAFLLQRCWSCHSQRIPASQRASDLEPDEHTSGTSPMDMDFVITPCLRNSSMCHSNPPACDLARPTSVAARSDNLSRSCSPNRGRPWSGWHSARTGCSNPDNHNQAHNCKTVLRLGHFCQDNFALQYSLPKTCVPLQRRLHISRAR